ncbi:cytochrome P450 12b1, mitochondrial-like [Sabethes cyaneus]|uniref:cytochrome P450 12b1, mitochondrial-like n=1 Tax=Sabethes cyaneus TaxID=53552 RepID=UPI00237E0CB7|nr:cytochrome P450 12b1, mitochondrial-like [Sabethes cyaneus]
MPKIACNERVDVYISIQSRSIQADKPTKCVLFAQFICKTPTTIRLKTPLSGGTFGKTASVPNNHITTWAFSDSRLVTDNIVKLSGDGCFSMANASPRTVFVRLRSAQAVPDAVTGSAEPTVDPDWADALPYEKIPGPGNFTMIRYFAPGGPLHNVSLVNIHEFFREKYGDLLRMPAAFGRKEILLSFNPDDYQKLFRADGQWPIRPALASFVYYRKKLRPEVFHGLGGLVSEQGEPWQTFRTAVNPVMMQPKVIKLYVNKVDAVAREFMEIMKIIRDDKNELPADFNQWLNRWALESMGVLALDTRLGVLGEQLSDEAEHIVTSIRKFFELTYHLDILPSIWKVVKTPKFYQLMNTLDDLTRLVKSKVDDAVVRLDQNPSVGSDNQSVLEKLLKVDRDIAVLMAFDMLLAGVDTTSSGTVGILYCLALNPDKQEKLREELRTILPNKDSPLTPENMRNLPYLRACIKEGIRVCPPTAGNLRAAGKDLVLQGYKVPKGTEVAMAAMLLQKDEKYYSRAKEFIPERWLKEETDGCPAGKNTHPFVYLPFGFGSRTCIGKRMANLEMEIIVARITRMFDYRWNYGELKIRAAVVNIPDSELKFEVREVEK